MKKYWELSKELPNKKNHEIIGEFLLSLQVTNRSEATIIAYRKFLEFFLKRRLNFTPPWNLILY